MEASPRQHDKPKAAGRTDDEIHHHLALMIEAGLIRGEVSKSMGQDVPAVLVSGITWNGYEFLDDARESGRWQTAKSVAASAGGIGLDVLKQVLADLAKKSLGLP